MKKKSIWILVASVLAIVLVVAFVLFKEAWADKISCEVRRGEYRVDIFFGNRFCYPKSIPEAARKTFVGKVLSHPDDVSLEIVFTDEKKGVVEGYVRNRASREKTGNRVFAYTDHILVQENSKGSFYAPLYIETAQGMTAYLGLFSFFENGPPKKYNNYYKNIYLMNSYSFGDKVVIDEIKLIRIGSYSSQFSILIHSAHAPQDKKSVDLRYFYELDQYLEYEGCVDPKKIISRERGDGKSYDICLFENGNECAMDTYEKGNCPFNGYEVSQINDEMVKYGIVKGQLMKNGEFVFRGDDVNYLIEDFYYGRREFQY